MESWLSTTTRIPSLQADVCFQLHETLYYGPDRFTNPSDHERLVEQLELPRIQQATLSLVRTAEVLGHEAALAAYYAQVVRLARQHALPFNSIRHYFWLRLCLRNAEHDIHLSFPWYDSYAEIERYLSALVETDAGLVDHDIDQGWESRTYAHEGAVYFQQQDPDRGEVYLAISVPRDALIHQVQQLRARSTRIIAALASALGADVWTSYVRDEPVFHTTPG